MIERRPGILGKIDALRQRRDTREVSFFVVDGKGVSSNTARGEVFTMLEIAPDARVVYERTPQKRWELTKAYDADGGVLPSSNEAVDAYLSGREGWKTSNSPTRYFFYDEAGKPEYEIQVRALQGKFPTK